MLIVVFSLSIKNWFTFCTVLNSTLPWKGKIINGIEDVTRYSPIASIRNSEAIPIFSAVIISGYHVLTAASLTREYENQTNFNGIFGIIGFEFYDIKYIESHRRFVPSHSDYDIALIALKRVRILEPTGMLSPPAIPDRYICTNIAPEGGNRYRVNDNFIFRGYLNRPYLHYIPHVSF